MVLCAKRGYYKFTLSKNKFFFFLSLTRSSAPRPWWWDAWRHTREVSQSTSVEDSEAGEWAVQITQTAPSQADREKNTPLMRWRSWRNAIGSQDNFPVEETITGIVAHHKPWQGDLPVIQHDGAGVVDQEKGRLCTDLRHFSRMESKCYRKSSADHKIEQFDKFLINISIDSFHMTWWPWKPAQLDGHFDWLHFDTYWSLSNLYMLIHCALTWFLQINRYQNVINQVAIQLRWFPWSPCYVKRVYTRPWCLLAVCQCDDWVAMPGSRPANHHLWHCHTTGDQGRCVHGQCPIMTSHLATQKAS